MTSQCETTGYHENVVEDKFAKLSWGQVKRSVPGDCYCLDCHRSIPAWWNRGNPIPADETEKNTSPLPLAKLRQR